MSDSIRQGVILAAGRGKRLNPLSRMHPKPLQPVCNKPILQYQLDIMREAGIREVLIIVGEGGAKIEAAIGDGHRQGMRIEYREDPEPAGIASSLSHAEGWVHGPFVVFLGDIFLAVSGFDRALTPVAAGAEAAIVVRRDEPQAVSKNFAVVTDASGRVTRVVEKPKHPPSDLKGCGIYVFRKSIFEAIRRTPRSALRNEYEITDAVQALISDGGEVHAVDVVKWDINVTFPSDLLECNLRMLREQELERMIGEGAWISAEAELIGSVVGEGARVDGPVRLQECLVLPRARVEDLAGTFQRKIFVDSTMVQAEPGAGT